VLNKTIELCFLNSGHSLKSELCSLFHVSNSYLKKYKKFLTKENDIKAKEKYRIPINIVNYGLVNPLYDGPQVKVLYEDEDFLVLSKPVKIHSHPLGYDESDNLLSFLRENGFDKVLWVNSKQYDRGLLHRLDFETSGVILLAKKQQIYEYVRNYPSDFFKQKVYLAIVNGKIEKTQTLVHYLSSCGKKKAKVKASQDDHPDAFRAECLVEPLDYHANNNLSLVRLKLKEGKRHQLRVQMAANKTPILGDPLYGTTPAQRMFLHSLSYEVFYQKKYSFQDHNLESFKNFFDLNSEF
jgi:23S rRNA pseudouridine1911/1915/1917 synthase